MNKLPPAVQGVIVGIILFAIAMILAYCIAVFF
jgi:hypothetical protein